VDEEAVVKSDPMAGEPGVMGFSKTRMAAGCPLEEAE
jgi:hypothetical protein